MAEAKPKQPFIPGSHRHPMPVVAFAAAAGLSIPFAAQRTLVRKQYLSVVAMALWLLIANVVGGVNAVVWAGSDAVHIPAWCDIGEYICCI